MNGLKGLLVGTLIFLHLPVLALAVFSFSRSRLSASFDGPSLVWYEKLLNNGPLMRAMENSLIVGGLSTLIVLIIATAAALGTRSSPKRTGERVASLFLVPLVTPEIVFGASLLVFFSRLFIPLGIGTVVAAHVIFPLSFAYFVIRARVHTLPLNVEEAARDLGANEWTTFRRVTLPMIAPGVLAGAMLAFTLSLDDFIITFFTSGPGSTTLPIYVYGLLRRIVTPEVNALSTLWILGVLVLVFIYQWVEHRE